MHTQHTIGHPSNVPSPNFACNSKTQVTQHPELTHTSMMLAVNCMRNCWTATSYTEYHRNGCIHAACSPGCRPLGSHSRLATIPSATPRSLHRYKTLPARSPEGSPGTKLSPHTQKRRFRPTFRTQGESFHAHANNKPRRENFVPHARPVPVQNSPSTRPRRAHPVQNSPSTRPRRAQPVQNSPSTRPRRAHPVQNSPDTPEIPLFGPL